MSDTITQLTDLFAQGLLLGTGFGVLIGGFVALLRAA